MGFISYDSDDAVVWKPWENSKTMVDLGDDKYKSILCVDVNYFEPMRRRISRLILIAVKSSFCFDQLEL